MINKSNNIIKDSKKNIFELLDEFIEDEVNKIYVKKLDELEDTKLCNIFKQKYFTTLDKYNSSSRKDTNLTITKIDNKLKDGYKKNILCITPNLNDYKLIKFIIHNKFSDNISILHNNSFINLPKLTEFDLILLDSKINYNPENLKKMNPNNVIILGNISSKFIKIGIEKFITKPFNINKLISNISNL